MGPLRALGRPQYERSVPGSNRLGVPIPIGPDDRYFGHRSGRHPAVKLSGGRRIGLGTYSEGDREQWAERVGTALDVGYRHVDTAQGYGNEEYVGEGIARSDVDPDFGPWNRWLGANRND
jgi:hypothetical protein